MYKYFAKEWTGEPFELFSTSHLIVILVFILFNLSFIWLKKQDRSLQDKVRYFILFLLILGEGGWQIWNLAVGSWTIHYHLPFHLCAVTVWLSVYMMIKKSYPVFEFVYFLGIAGATQAFLTPETGIYGFPHYRVMQTLVTHGTIISAALFMTIVEGMRPTWSSLKRLFFTGNLLLVVATAVNLLIGSNYMYTMGPPINPSLIDHLGPWPWYVISMELIAIVVCFLLYLPWWIVDLNKVRNVK